MIVSILQFKSTFGDVATNFKTVSRLIESFDAASSDVILSKCGVIPLALAMGI